MQKQYKHLSLVEREKIAEMQWEGKTVSYIATMLNRDKSTISREVCRNASPSPEYYIRFCRNAKALSKFFALINFFFNPSYGGNAPPYPITLRA